MVLVLLPGLKGYVTWQIEFRQANQGIRSALEAVTNNTSSALCVGIELKLILASEFLLSVPSSELAKQLHAIPGPLALVIHSDHSRNKRRHRVGVHKRHMGSTQKLTQRQSLTPRTKI